MGLDGIEVKGHYGTWHVISERIYEDGYTQRYLLEHEEQGDEVPCIIVDENANLILEDVYNGWDDLDCISLKG